VLVKTGIYFLRDYMLGNVDNVGWYLIKSFGFMFLEIAFIAVGSSALVDHLSKKKGLKTIMSYTKK
jgi:nucleoside recognition membrane protein YjiH